MVTSSLNVMFCPLQHGVQSMFNATPVLPGDVVALKSICSSIFSSHSNFYCLQHGHQLFECNVLSSSTWCSKHVNATPVLPCDVVVLKLIFSSIFSGYSSFCSLQHVHQLFDCKVLPISAWCSKHV